MLQKYFFIHHHPKLHNELFGPSGLNWLEQWTPPVLQKLQMEDETISTVISYIEQNNTKPSLRSQNQDLVSKTAYFTVNIIK